MFQTVSRNEIFEDHEESFDDGKDVYGNIEFEEIEVPTEETEKEPPAEVMEFQLFGNAQPMKIDLVDKKEENVSKRPNSYYFFTLTPELRNQIEISAVSGADVLNEAKFWKKVISNRNFVAPDINADYRPLKKRCRPGKNARASRRKAKQIKYEPLQRPYQYVRIPKSASALYTSNKPAPKKAPPKGPPKGPQKAPSRPAPQATGKPRKLGHREFTFK